MILFVTLFFSAGNWSHNDRDISLTAIGKKKEKKKEKKQPLTRARAYADKSRLIFSAFLFFSRRSSSTLFLAMLFPDIFFLKMSYFSAWRINQSIIPTKNKEQW